MDYSMIAPQARKQVEERASPPPPQPPPCEEFAHYHRPGEPYYMNGYVSQVEQLLRIRGLNSIELTRSKHSMRLRMNFRDYMDDDIDDHYYYGYVPSPVPHEVHPYPPRGYPEPAPRPIPIGLPPPPPLGPPRPRYMTRGPPPLPSSPSPPLPPPHHGLSPHWPEQPEAPSPVGYPPSNYFSDENPNGCTMM